jgi:FdhD protein
VYKTAGSVHGCALFAGEEMLLFVEDVGRHNAIDTIAGWMALNGVQPEGKVFYTTGRLTSEMVVKAAQMGIAVVRARRAITLWAPAGPPRLGLCAIGRATNKRFVCFSGAGRLHLQPELAGLPVRAAA